MSTLQELAERKVVLTYYKNAEFTSELPLHLRERVQLAMSIMFAQELIGPAYLKGKKKEEIVIWSQRWGEVVRSVVTINMQCIVS
jgi:hypothetical protein